MAYAVLALLSILVLMMAWPRWLASLQFLPVQQARGTLYQSSQSSPDFQSLIKRSERTIAIHDDYSYHSALSLLYYLQGTDARASLQVRRVSLEQTLQEAKIAIHGAPLQPDIWLLMAQAGAQAFLPANEMAAFFRMAIWSGRVEPTHLIGRLQIGFALQRHLDEVSLGLLRDQALLAWNLKQHEFISAIRSNKLQRARVEALMRDSHPDVVREMEAVLGPATL